MTIPAMTGQKESSGRRKERLAKALKANIAKRKAQAQTRKAQAPARESAKNQ
jgi:hypothetical protein